MRGTAATHDTTVHRSKRIIVCCDGTWENATGAGDQPLTNVTRLSRSLRRLCSDGTHQIIYYHPGVGTGGLLDTIAGGALGMGLGADIREAYNYVCTNYVDGDDIVLVGFSRGAFTARSIADLIASIGLLNTAGMTYFYSIFEDYENMADQNRGADDFLEDSYEVLSEYQKGKEKDKVSWENQRKNEYREWLISKNWTRDTFKDSSELIKVKAVAVWDTVGSLGIPPIPIIGIRGSAAQWKFANTQISSKVEYAFQALSLDEPRGAFRPALWERYDDNTTTKLKQVWFPGSHANVGGGWYDQQIACITLAWICDQLAPLGVEFSPRRITKLFYSALRFNAAHPYPFIPSPSILIPSWVWSVMLRSRVPIPWASSPVPCPPPAPSQRIDRADYTGKYDRLPHEPAQGLWRFNGRPWGLGQTRYPTSWFETASGTIVRRPGCFMMVDPDTNEDTMVPLRNTNERVHSCVRARLRLGGMGLDDRQRWPCESLLQDDSGEKKPVWRLEKGSGIDPTEAQRDGAFWDGQLERNVKGYNTAEVYVPQEGDGQWKWVFDETAVVRNGSGKRIRPAVKVLPEEPMVGYWERHLLALTRGDMDVWRLAEGKPKGATSLENFA